MPDTQFIAVILLLTVAVVAGYFYLKRWQARDAATPSKVDYPEAAAPAAATSDHHVDASADERRGDTG